MKKIRLSGLLLFFLLILIPVTGFTQDLEPEQELYLNDPDPRFHGEQVKALQKFLLFNNCDIGPDGMDGWFGADTHNALLEYQRKHRLPQTGRIKIKDFIKILHWIPRVQSPGSESFPNMYAPSEKTAALDPVGDSVIVDNYYGHIEIPVSYTYGLLIDPPDPITYTYSEFTLSPSGRFVSAKVTLPEDSDDWKFNGDRMICWDVLTGDSMYLECYLAFMHPDYQALYEGYSNPRSIGYFWTDDDELVLMVRVFNGVKDIDGFVTLSDGERY